MPRALAKALTKASSKPCQTCTGRRRSARGQLFGIVDDAKMGMCNAGVKFHAGAVEAWEEAGHKIAACAKPSG